MMPSKDVFWGYGLRTTTMRLGNDDRERERE